MTMDNPVKEKTTVSENVCGSEKEPDPWRICPIGQHWVREHALHIPASQKNPGGVTTIRHAHCADNPHPYRNKNVLSYDEIQEITKKHFETLRASKIGMLGEFPDKNKFDKYILGWTQYFNKIFHPVEPLDPNLVKVLIASESSFDEKIEKIVDGIYARGLMQIRRETFGYLQGEKKELQDHIFIFTEHNLFDPSTNICAGIRWLFRKREIAKAILKREPSWEESVMSFKGDLSPYTPNSDGMQRFRALYAGLIKK